MWLWFSNGESSGAIDIDTTPSFPYLSMVAMRLGRHLRQAEGALLVPPLLPYLEGIDKAASR
jgi:hypothetical protein